MVEQLTCNQQVAGSSPIASSTVRKRSSSGGIPERPKGTDCKSVVVDFGGSNPPPSTIKYYRRDEITAGLRRLYVACTGLQCCLSIQKSSDLQELAGVAQLARASAFQAEGRGFESRFPLQFSSIAHIAQEVEHFLGKEEVSGSSPDVGSIYLFKKSVKRTFRHSFIGRIPSWQKQNSKEPNRM